MRKLILITTGLVLVLAVLVALQLLTPKSNFKESERLNAPSAGRSSPISRPFKESERLNAPSAGRSPPIGRPHLNMYPAEQQPMPQPNAPSQAEQGRIAQILRDRQAALTQLPTGKIVLDAPKAMKVGEVREVRANVGINVPIEVLRKHSSNENTQSTEGALRVSSEMIAVLTGPAFKITATKPEQQGVAEGFPTVWSWDIEARQEGQQELEATLYVLLPSAYQSFRQRIDSYTHKIGVSVKEQTWDEWLKSRKEEIDAVKALTITGVGAITAVLGWLGWSYGSRKKNEELT